MAEKVASDSSENPENLVFAALQQRHMRERIEQEEIFKNEIAAARAKAKANVYATREAEKDELQAKQDKVS